ncbi:MAG: epoxyqueuosine reductase [Desulfurispora sp.]|uniref:epoxyqueuosine reductase n=1 Tax=Desulfurispora sp. TaxID=3014275 RepID=UPI004049DC18
MYLLQDIHNLIAELVQSSPHPLYSTPLVGVASADDPLFARLRELVGPGHLLPRDILPEARSVVAFFVPFRRELVLENKNHPYVARSWAEAYIVTNQLIEHICAMLAAHLANRGIRAAWQKPTHNFDPEKLVSFWSHKHVAYICGLGTFGLHHMLITAAGCAGRLGSIVLDCELPVTQRPEQEYCQYKRKGTCQVCVKTCPTGALTAQGLNKKLCYIHLLEVDAHYRDLSLCDVCGKCATGPCACYQH